MVGWAVLHRKGEKRGGLVCFLWHPIVCFSKSKCYAILLFVVFFANQNDVDNEKEGAPMTGCTLCYVSSCQTFSKAPERLSDHQFLALPCAVGVGCHLDGHSVLRLLQPSAREVVVGYRLPVTTGMGRFDSRGGRSRVRCNVIDKSL